MPGDLWKAQPGHPKELLFLHPPVPRATGRPHTPQLELCPQGLSSHSTSCSSMTSTLESLRSHRT
jgi:hypothetical protein